MAKKECSRGTLEEIRGIENASCRVENGREILESCHDLPDIPGVQACARVLDDGKTVSNRIVFKNKKCDSEGSVNCVHTAIASISPEQLERGSFEFAESTEGKKIALSPIEHFRALSSYVAGMFENGIKNAVKLTYFGCSPDELPFGFNSSMQFQVFRALRRVAPEETEELVKNLLYDLAESVNPEWLNERYELLDEMYGISEVICDDLELFDAFGGIKGSTIMRKRCAHLSKSTKILKQRNIPATFMLLELTNLT